MNINELNMITIKSKEYTKNYELLDQIYNLVIADNDKYPKRSLSNEFFPQYKIMRNRSKITNNNILKLFDDSFDKKNSPQIGQYSFSKHDLFHKDIENEIYYCFHHNDMDGEASASVVANKFSLPANTKFYSAPFNYNDNEFRNWIYKVKRNKANNTNKNFVLYVTDLSLKSNELKLILTIFDKVIWIDHHITSLTVVNNIDQRLLRRLNYIIDTRFCATFLTRFFLKRNLIEEKDDKLLPFYRNTEISYLINVFDLKLDKRFPKEYEYGTYLNAYYFSFGNINMYSLFWFCLINNLNDDKERIEEINKVLSVGKEIYELDLKKNKLMFDNDFKYISNIKLNNISIPEFRLVGIYQHGSPNKITGFDDDIPTIKALARYNEKESTIYFSLFTDSDILGKLNLGKILIKYGLGGGHPKACGGTIRFSDFLKLYTNIERILENKNSIRNYRNYKLEGVTKNWNKECLEIYNQINFNKKNDDYESSENKIRYEFDINLFMRLITQIIGDEIVMM